MANSLLGSVLSSGTAGYGLFNQAEDIKDIGAQANIDAQALGQAAIDGTQFQPFSVASQTGNIGADAQGNITSALNGPQQGIADSAAAGATGMFNAAQIGPEARQQSIFDQIMAGMLPGQQRQQTALQSQAQNQGRGGISTGEYGGSPEQFALYKAQQEANLGAWGQAQQLAMGEQAQQADIGNMFAQASLRPEAALFNQLNPAIQTADLGQTGQIAGQNLNSQAGVAGLEAEIQANVQASNLYGGAFAALAPAAGNLGDYVQDNAGNWVTKFGEVTGLY